MDMPNGLCRQQKESCSRRILCWPLWASEPRSLHQSCRTSDGQENSHNTITWTVTWDLNGLICHSSSREMLHGKSDRPCISTGDTGLGTYLSCSLAAGSSSNWARRNSRLIHHSYSKRVPPSVCSCCTLQQGVKREKNVDNCKFFLRRLNSTTSQDQRPTRAHSLTVNKLWAHHISLNRLLRGWQKN